MKKIVLPPFAKTNLIQIQTKKKLKTIDSYNDENPSPNQICSKLNFPKKSLQKSLMEFVGNKQKIWSISDLTFILNLL